MSLTKAPSKLDKLVGLAMLVAASVIFTYYTIWTLLIVRHVSPPGAQSLSPTQISRPWITTCPRGPHSAWLMRPRSKETEKD